MPIEIRELVIKAVISSPPNERNTSNESFSSELNIDTIIQVAVDQVLKILKDKNER